MFRSSSGEATVGSGAGGVRRSDVVGPVSARRARQCALARVVGGVCMVTGVAAGCGSATWLLNGFADPTQQGNFRHPVRLEIRDSLSVLEEPLGIQNAEEPTAADSVVNYVEPVIGPGDVLSVSIFELLTPGQSTDLQIQVRNSGFETLPVLGPVKIAGFTVRELELELIEKLREAEILDNAEVQVSILRSESAQFTVLGRVATPGNYPLPRPDYRLMNVLGAVGGIPDNVTKIYVIRDWDVEQRMRRSGSATAPSDSTARPDDETPAPIMLASLSNSAPPPATVPAEEGINELEILEGEREAAAGGDGPEYEYDPATGEWILRGAESRPTTSAGAEAESVTSSGAAGGAVPTGSAEAEVEPGEQPLEEDLAEEEALRPKVRIIEVPTKPLLAGDPRYNIVIRPHDLVNIPPGMVGEFFLAGNVTRPGAYSLTGREITVKQAIASAGGFGPLAWPARADLVRRISGDEEQMIQIDLDAIFSGKTPDFYLRPNDIVNVGSSPASAFLAVLRNSFRLSYGFGFVYDRNFADSDSFSAREQVKNRRRLEAQARGLPF